MTNALILHRSKMSCAWPKMVAKQDLECRFVTEHTLYTGRSWEMCTLRLGEEKLGETREEPRLPAQGNLLFKDQVLSSLEGRDFKNWVGGQDPIQRDFPFQAESSLGPGNSHTALVMAITVATCWRYLFCTKSWAIDFIATYQLTFILTPFERCGVSNCCWGGCLLIFRVK